ncbi:hypothetical protein CDD81_3729 [Ophiocordyceps australis]|uniref:UFSP1/2/DUB catalytic domain-containing protein n=1 Tax=Ophiocordyceps australis TaxID=1399860 RepID=A0A2C5YC92_9HYPO|nr:hypothetical protein CDD81_3729 [Ophiocordyceps australis]
MPTWLVKILATGHQPCTSGVLPVLGQLLEQCHYTKYAYLCHASVQHVSKLRREGGFCGYRNIQMLFSYADSAQISSTHPWEGKFPSIFEIQDLIEHAWDQGYNTQGRIETGGIRGSRKFIGTPEAQALFCSLGIPCSVHAYRDEYPTMAYSLLLQAIEEYFQHGWKGNSSIKIRRTQLAPVYLQHQGHSVTIVGFERQKDEQAHILVFDPWRRDSSWIRKLGRGGVMEGPMSRSMQLLEPYRRGVKYLSRHAEFETLCLTTSQDASC